MSKDQKWLGYRHHVAMVTIVPSIPLPKQQKEGNWNDQIEEEDESISLLKQNTHSLQEVNIG